LSYDAGVLMNRKNSWFLIILLMFLPASIMLAATEDFEGEDIFEYANELLQLGRYDEALRTYEIFINENPEHHLVAAAKWAMANIYFTIEKDYSRAGVIYQNMINKHRDTIWEIFSYDRLGFCYEAQEKWSDAARVYETALNRLTAESHRGLVQEWSDVFITRLITAYRNLNERENIIRIYEEALANDPAGPSAPDYQFNLAQVYLEVNGSRKAAMNFATVVERYPLSDPAQRVQNEYADLLAEEVDYDWLAFDTFQSSVKLSQTGHYEEALAGFEKVIADTCHKDMAYAARFQKDLLQFRKSGNAEALRDKASESRDSYPYGFGGLPAAQLLYFLDQIINAKASVRAKADDAGAYGTMAFAYYQLQSYHLGIEAYKKAISLAPENTSLYNILGYCYMGVEAYDDAIEAFQKVIDISPEDPNSYDSMAEAYYAKGDTKRAMKFYEQALSIDSSFTNPYYMLGEINSEIGQHAKARKYLEKYLELDPDGFRVHAAQTILREMTEEQE
jgi:tetratricopeptide (TPR) repeat protein